MNSLPNENQLFYKKDDLSPWKASTSGTQWPNEKCEGYLHKHLTWGEMNTIKLDEYKEDKKDQLRDSCSSAIEGLIQSSALGSQKTYDCRGVDQLNLNMIVNAGIGGEIYTHDGTEFVWVQHTHDQCVQLLIDMNAHIKTQRDKLYQKVSLVNACTTCDEVDAINW